MKPNIIPRFAAGAAILAVGLFKGCGLAAQPAASQSTPAPTSAAAPAAAMGTAPPPGPALDLITAHCAACHETSIVFGQRKSADDWASTVQLMVDRGAELKPEEADTVVDYLTRNFPAAPH